MQISGATPVHQAPPTAVQEEEQDDSSEEPLASQGAVSLDMSAPSTSAETHTSVGPTRDRIVLSLALSHGTSEQKQMVETGTAAKTPHRRAQDTPSSAQLHVDARAIQKEGDPGGAGRSVGGSDRFCERDFQSMEESISNLSITVSQVMATVDCSMDRMATCIEQLMCHSQEHMLQVENRWLSMEHRWQRLIVSYLGGMPA
uniref:uncharacterized protein n=1 Tax=Pristiophorus japonicus TaxID=55135 RepID=UPI00398ED7C2